jgi:hypothetical protein
MIAYLIRFFQPPATDVVKSMLVQTFSVKSNIAAVEFAELAVFFPVITNPAERL